ncbi:MAG: aminotransferase class III-fold pyridoxal phosphate-dependent enzyme [Hellea sp.]
MQKLVRKSNIPGYSQLLSKRFDQFSYDYWPTSYKTAKGTMIQSSCGTWYKDMSISGIGACLFGYADDEVDECVIRTIKNGVASSLNSELEEKVAEALLQFIPGHTHVRYAKGGGEAMSIAIRIARSFTKKSTILFSGYHGWSDWYLAANVTDQSSLDNHLIKNLAPNGVPIELKGTSMPFEYNNLSDLSNKIEQNKSNLACIVMEPARSMEADASYLQGVKQLALKHSIPLIFDEISSGFRQSKGPYAAKFQVTPDIYVFAKSIGNGYPIAAITGVSSLMNEFNHSFISSTNWTEAVGLSATEAVLKKFTNSNPENKIVELGNYWAQIIAEVSAKSEFELQTNGLPGMRYMMHPADSDLFRTFFTKFGLSKNYLVAGRYYPNTAQTKNDIDGYAELLTDTISHYKKMNSRERLTYCGRVLPGGFNVLDIQHV